MQVVEIENTPTMMMTMSACSIGLLRSFFFLFCFDWYVYMRTKKEFKFNRHSMMMTLGLSYIDSRN